MDIEIEYIEPTNLLTGIFYDTFKSTFDHFSIPKINNEEKKEEEDENEDEN